MLMKKPFLLILIFLLSPLIIFSQTISEKELFNLKFKGNADTYNFIYDKASGNYCYLYRIEDQNKTFIISKNAESEKFDEIWGDEICFDSKGNYYAITANYKADYGLDNNFLIVNGKNVLNFPVIDSYDSYINKKGEFVFVFKQLDQYKIGYYSIGNALRQSEPFEAVKPVFKYKELPANTEGDEGVYREDDFYHNEKGERGFIAVSNGKAKIIFESEEIPTDYSDINEMSVIKNKNNELSFIAKTNGKFYESAGEEFVVSGKNSYDKFQLVSYPLMFNAGNDPVYIAGDSISEFAFNYYLVVGNEVQTAYTDGLKTKKAPDFGYGISVMNISDDGGVTYEGLVQIVVPAQNENPDGESYDSYYSEAYFVKDGIASELGYNPGPIKFNEKGDMLYSAIADLNKKEYLLMMNYGESKIIINKDRYDGIIEYGFTPGNEIYYVGQNYENYETGEKSQSDIYIGDKRIGKVEYVIYQYSGDSSYVFVFGPGDNYAIAAQEQIDPNTFSSYVITASGRLPFPGNNVAGSKMFSYISNLMYLKNDKLFYIGDMTQYDTVTNEVKKEIFVNNESLGKIYNTISDFWYDEALDQMTFIGSRGKKIYFVTVKF